MATIRIEDLPVMSEVSAEESKGIFGGTGPTNPVASAVQGAQIVGPASEIVGDHARRIDPQQGVTALERATTGLSAFCEGFGRGFLSKEGFKALFDGHLFR